MFWVFFGIVALEVIVINVLKLISSMTIKVESKKNTEDLYKQKEKEKYMFETQRQRYVRSGSRINRPRR
jgi:hypothetical protein